MKDKAESVKSFRNGYKTFQGGRNYSFYRMVFKIYFNIYNHFEDQKKFI